MVDMSELGRIIFWKKMIENNPRDNHGQRDMEAERGDNGEVCAITMVRGHGGRHVQNLC